MNGPHTPLNGSSPLNPTGVVCEDYFYPDCFQVDR